MQNLQVSKIYSLLGQKQIWTPAKAKSSAASNVASVLGKKGDKGAAGKGADEGPADPAPAATAAEEPTGAKLIWI